MYIIHFHHSFRPKMRLGWTSKTLILVILKYIVIIASTIAAYHVFFAPFHAFAPFTTQKHVFNRSIDIVWPRHVKNLLMYPASLQLVFIDDPFLTCVTGTDQAKKAHACQQTKSDDVLRIGTYMTIEQFKNVFADTVMKFDNGVNDTWAFEDTGNDTLVLRYHYHENFDKYIVVNYLNKKEGMNYYRINGKRNLKTIGIRHFTNEKFDLTPSVGVKRCEKMCFAYFPKELHRHMMYLKAVELLDCDHQLAAINVKPNATWNIPKETLPVLDSLLDAYIESNQMPFLCHGTMLGWYRDCGIIPHTTDMDFCILAEEYVANFHKKFINHSLHPPMRIIGKEEYGYELTYWLYHNVTGKKAAYVDIFYMYKENETHSWTPLLMDFSRGVRVKDILLRIEKFCLADIYGHLYFVTCDPLTYVTTRYGETWNQSNPNAGYFEKGVKYANNGNWNMKKNEYYKAYG